jgi:hypothetical protein
METTGASDADAGRSKRGRQLSPPAAERISAGCYGALVSASTLMGLGDADLGAVVTLVVLTNLVYFAIHVFAYTIGDTDTTRTPLAVMTHHLAVSAPMISVTFAPVLCVSVLVLFGVAIKVAVLWGVGVALAYLVSVATAGAALRGYSPLAIVGVAIVSAVGSAALLIAKISLH